MLPASIGKPLTSHIYIPTLLQSNRRAMSSDMFKGIPNVHPHVCEVLLTEDEIKEKIKKIGRCVVDSILHALSLLGLKVACIK